MPHTTSVHPAVLFDLDGTLIDSLELLVGAMQHAFASHDGPRPTVEEWVATIGRPLLWQFGQYASAPEQLERLVVTYRSYQYEHHDRLTRAYDEIPGLVSRLRDAGHPLGVVTSKMDALANRSLAHVALSPLFDVVVGADRTSHHKPGPEPVLYALAQLGVAPAHAVYIGDSPFDMMSANAAGVTSIGVTWGASSHATLLPAEPDHVVTTPAELESLLAELRTAQSP